MSELILYHSPGTCSSAAHVLLEETGEPYRLDLRLVRNGETSSEAYLRINPKGRVPALHIPGQERVLTELPAVCWYITRNTPELRPQGHIAEARALEWFNYLSGTLHTAGYGLLWRTQRFAENAAFHDEMQQKARKNVQECNDHIEASLAGRPWALGDSYSLIDPFLLVFYTWGLLIGMDMRRHAAWTDHTGRIVLRPAVQRAYAQGGLQTRLDDVGAYLDGRLAEPKIR
ncbi:glutathione S-transferase family protein [Rhodoligotrophos defluvii]|uniref:glutathione S-transferase family protein n=1 Tax=Rhodoligotrophos defluvii TaxID=2561934 RepID=UPI0010C9895E|nr:glutathione S-transferase N-terminal domain-containing protein [Rhodoligotrophos defluvii]